MFHSSRCLSVAGMLFFSGCGNQTARSPEDVHAPQHAEVLCGVWFAGLPKTDAGRIKTAGVFLQDSRHPAVSCSIDTLAQGTIVGAFRSAREAWKIATELEETTSSKVVWYRAEYGATLELVAQDPPRVEKYNEDGAFDNWPMGEADSGLRHGSLVWFLPSPLQERGVAIVMLPNAQASAVYTVWPADVSTSMTTSWGDYDRRVAPLKPQVIYVYAPNGEPALGDPTGFDGWRAEHAVHDHEDR